MRSISILIILCLCVCLKLRSQGYVEILIDPVVAGQKTTITGLLNTELALKRKQRDLLKELEDLEEEYKKKRGIKSAITSSAAVFAALQSTMIAVGKRIESIESNIDYIRKLTFYIPHGLGRLESALEREKGYYERLKSEQQYVSVLAPASGGGGYAYTVFQRLIIRAMKIQDNLIEIDKDVKSRSVASWLLYLKNAN